MVENHFLEAQQLLFLGNLAVVVLLHHVVVLADGVEVVVVGFVLE